MRNLWRIYGHWAMAPLEGKKTYLFAGSIQVTYKQNTLVKI